MIFIETFKASFDIYFVIRNAFKSLDIVIVKCEKISSIVIIAKSRKLLLGIELR